MTASYRPLRTVRGRILATGAVMAAGALLLTGCGDQTDGGKSSGSASSGEKAPFFDLLPQKYQDAKVIKAGADIAYAPVEFKENGKSLGIDPDLGDALGKQLGVKFEFEDSVFDNLITSLQSKRFDVIMSAMSDTKARQTGTDSETGKKVGPGLDFVDYFKAGSSILVKQGNPKGITSLDDLCGQTVAVQRGSTSENVLKRQQKTCADKGKGQLKIDAFDSDSQALLQVKQGRAAAHLNDFPVAAYNVQTSGGGKDFEIVGDQIEANPYGIALRKEDTKLRDAIKAALEAMVKNGDYQKVLEKWNVTDGAVKQVTLNGGSN